MNITTLPALFAWAALALALPTHATVQTPADAKAQEASAPAVLSMAGWTLEERLALGLHQISLGHLATGLATLQDSKDAELDEELEQRLQRATERTQALMAARDQLMNWAVDNKKSLRWPLKDKMVVLKPKSWKNGVLTVRKSKKHEVTELRAQDMTMAFLAANFKKKSTKYGAGWLESYCLAMAGMDKWQAALPKNFPGETEFSGDLKQAQKLIPAGPFVAAMASGVEGQGETEMDFEDMSKTLKSRRWLGHRKPLLLELARRNYTAQVRSEGLAVTLNAEVEELENGRMRFTYAFGEEVELADFKEDDRWWKQERSAYSAKPEETEEASISKGNLWLQGEHSLVHVLEFKGDMSMEMSAYHDFDPDEDELNLGTIMPAINAAPPYHFARGNYGLLLAIDGPRSKARTKQSEIDGNEFRIDDSMVWRIWTAKKKAHMEFNDNEEATVEFEPNRAGTALIWVHSEYPIGVEKVVIEGKPTKASKQALADRWLVTQLKALDLGYDEDE